MFKFVFENITRSLLISRPLFLSRPLPLSKVKGQGHQGQNVEIPVFGLVSEGAVQGQGHEGQGHKGQGQNHRSRWQGQGQSF